MPTSTTRSDESTTTRKFSHLKNLTVEQRKRYDEFVVRCVIPNRYADKQALEKIGLLKDVTHLLKRIGCEQLLNFDAPTYEDMIYEFLSTFEYKEAQPVQQPAIHFCLLGKQYVLREMEVQRIFGWKHFVTRTLPEFNVKVFWKILTMKESEVYSGRRSKSSRIGNPSYRHIYKLLAYSLFGRLNIGPVSKLELVILYCLDKGNLVEFVTILTRRIKEVIPQKEGSIMVGCFVTMIAKHLSRFLINVPQILLCI